MKSTARERSLLKLFGIDVSRLTEADIKTGAELARRISQCERVAGSCKRRPAAIADWRNFLARIGDPIRDRT